MVDPDEDEPYSASPRQRARRAVVKGVAFVLVIGMLVAFPLGYVLDTDLRTRNIEGTFALLEVTIGVVLIALVRASRRR